MSKKKQTGAEQALKISPMAQVLADERLALPACRAPSLDRLVVSVPPAPALSADELVLRLHERARQLAPRRTRAGGEKLALGDEALLDVVGYCGGKLLPFSARFGTWVDLEPLPELPGFHEAIARGSVGASVQVNLTYPADFPLPQLRGLPAHFIVDIKAAHELKPAALDSAELLNQLGVSTVDEAMNLMRDELQNERRQALQVIARERVLDELARRSDPKVPQSLVDEEIRRRWADAEGKAMVERHYDLAEQQEALQAWLKDPVTRSDCERRIKVSLALKAMSEAEHLTISAPKLQALLAEHVSELGLSAADVAQGLRESKEITTQVVQLGFHLMAVDFAMSKATVLPLPAKRGEGRGEGP